MSKIVAMTSILNYEVLRIIKNKISTISILPGSSLYSVLFQGYSGGPLMYFKEKWKIVGTVSWGVGCLNWIYNIWKK